MRYIFFLLSLFAMGAGFCDQGFARQGRDLFEDRSGTPVTSNDPQPVASNHEDVFKTPPPFAGNSDMFNGVHHNAGYGDVDVFSSRQLRTPPDPLYTWSGASDR